MNVEFARIHDGGNNFTTEYMISKCVATHIMRHILCTVCLIDNEMGCACGAYGWGEGVYRILVGKQERKRPLGRPSYRYVDNIRMDLQELGCGYLDWIGLAQDRDSWRTLVECGNEPSGSVKCGEFLWLAANQLASQEGLHHAVSK